MREIPSCKMHTYHDMCGMALTILTVRVDTAVPLCARPGKEQHDTGMLIRSKGGYGTRCLLMLRLNVMGFCNATGAGYSSAGSSYLCGITY